MSAHHDPHDVIYINRKSPARVSLEQLDANENLRVYKDDISEKYLRQILSNLSRENGLRYTVEKCDGYFRVGARYAWDT